MRKLFVFLLPLIIFAGAAHAEVLPWRPSCQAITGPWIESHDGAGFQEFCYYNDTTFFVKMDLRRNFKGQLFKPTNPEAYIEGINYVQPAGPLKVGDINLSFEYYFPFYEDGTECPIDTSNFNTATGFHNVPQYILAGDESANFTTGSGTFNDVFLNFTLDAGCGQWRTFNREINVFDNDFGSSFSRNSRTLGTIGFEVSNIYIRNLRAIGAATPAVQTVW